jgi:hypothetical protein
MFFANVAQLVEQRIRNAPVVGSIPTVGFLLPRMNGCRSRSVPRGWASSMRIAGNLLGKRHE